MFYLPSIFRIPTKTADSIVRFSATIIYDLYADFKYIQLKLYR